MNHSLPFERLRTSGSSCGSVLLTLAVLPLLGLTVLTHYLAHRLGDPPELDPILVPILPPWAYLAAGASALYAAFRLGGSGWRLYSLAATLPAVVFALLARGPVYLPHQGLGWSAALLTHPQARGEILEAVAVSVAATLLAAALGLVLWRSGGSKRSPSAIAHGSSRPAGARDLREAGLLGSPTGIHLGAWSSRGKLLPLRDDSEDHVLLFTPSGAGKTSGTIVPTLLTSEHPAIVLDPKGEIYRLTAGWRRRMGHRCIYYSPSSPDSPAWNCLDEISRDSEIADLRVLAENLVAYPSYPTSDQGASHWTASARNLLRLLCLHALHAHPRPSLPSVLAQLHEGKDPFELFETIGSYPHDPDKGFRDLTSGEPTPTHRRWPCWPTPSVRSRTANWARSSQRSGSSSLCGTTHGWREQARGRISPSRRSATRPSPPLSTSPCPTVTSSRWRRCSGCCSHFSPAGSPRTDPSRGQPARDGCCSSSMSSRLWVESPSSSRCWPSSAATASARCWWSRT